MRCLTLWLASMQLCGTLTASAQKIIRHDLRFDQLMPSDAVVEKLADGVWLEGPVWNRTEGFLLFSDMPHNSIFKWQEGKGVSLFLRPSGYAGSAPFEGHFPGSNGLAYDTQGRLVLCDQGGRRLARLDADGTKTTLAARHLRKRLNSPNDLAVKSNGDLYFTDPYLNDARRELDFCGVYRLTPRKKLTLLTRELNMPNGIAFSPDEKTLYIANYETSRPVWMAFEVSAVGTISNGRVFFDATAWMKTKLGLPDGLKVDKEGNLFATGPGGLHVFARSGRTDRQDEPTASLDGVTGREIVDLLQGLARGEGCALILIAHDQRILSIADRLLHLEDMVCSRKEALGRTHQSRNPPKLYLRSGGGSFDGTSAPVG